MYEAIDNFDSRFFKEKVNGKIIKLKTSISTLCMLTQCGTSINPNDVIVLIDMDIGIILSPMMIS